MPNRVADDLGPSPEVEAPAPREERAAFWDARIIGWEESRYSRWSRLNPFSWTVRRRMDAARNLVSGELAGLPSVLDLGCGSGLLASAVVADRGRRYAGVDISAVAVAAARRRFAAHAERASFERRDVLDGTVWEASLIVFLGLVDWLEEAEIELLFRRLDASRLCFSFTEADAGLGGRLYGRYRRLRDGRIRAHSLREARVVAAAEAAGYRVDRIVRLSRLDPGRLAVAAKR